MKNNSILRNRLRIIFNFLLYFYKHVSLFVGLLDAKYGYAA